MTVSQFKLLLTCLKADAFTWYGVFGESERRYKTNIFKIIKGKLNRAIIISLVPPNDSLHLYFFRWWVICDSLLLWCFRLHLLVPHSSRTSPKSAHFVELLKRSVGRVSVLQIEFLIVFNGALQTSSGTIWLSSYLHPAGGCPTHWYLRPGGSSKYCLVASPT